MYYLGEVRPDSVINSSPAGTSDPYSTGRLKVWVRGVHPPELYNQSDLLPWAVVLYPSSNAGTGGAGNSSGSIEEGAQVFVTFVDEDKQHPVVFGVIPRVETSIDAGPYGGYNSEGDFVPGAGGGGGGGAGSVGDTVTPSGTWTSFEGTVGSGTVPEDKFWRDIVRWCNGTRGLNLERSKIIAAGVVGCSFYESKYRTTAQNRTGGGNGAKGLFQWRGSRQKKLINRGDWTKYENQIAHFFWENASDPHESKQWAKVESDEGSKNPQRAAAVFAIYWLRYVSNPFTFDQVVRKADVLSKDLNVGEASGSTVLRMQKAIAIYNNYRNELIPGIDYDGDRPGDP